MGYSNKTYCTIVLNFFFKVQFVVYSIALFKE